MQSKVSSGLVVAVTSVLNLEIVKEGEHYIECFSALVTVGVAPILVAMITVRVEIGGYTIQFYHFVYNPMGVYYLTSVHQMGYPFIFNGGLQIFITFHYQLQII